MPDLIAMDILIETGDLEGAGTDGNVYLGICGREFHCDSGADDFESNTARTYSFGDGSNVLNPDRNDPRSPQLRLEDVDLFPVYIRFEQGSNSDWRLRRAQLKLHGAVTHEFGFLPGEEGIWLGGASGSLLYVRRHRDTAAAAPPNGGAAE